MITIDFNRLDIKPGHRILDIGCGEGRHTARAWEFPGTFCVGADMCHDDLLISSEKLKLHEAFMQEIQFQNRSQETESPTQGIGNSSKWALSTADITRLPFADHSFDIIICSEVMEHIHEEQKALAELKRILKPGGTLALSVPRYWPEKVCWKLSRAYSRSRGGHIRIYRQQELLDKVSALNFIPAGRHHYAHSLHTPYWWLKCLVGLDRIDSKMVNFYHTLLVWDLMKQPFITRFAEKVLNPVMGKSVVFYFHNIVPG